MLQFLLLHRDGGMDRKTERAGELQYAPRMKGITGVTRSAKLDFTARRATLRKPASLVSRH
jgi:hypothetical protein